MKQKDNSGNDLIEERIKLLKRMENVDSKKAYLHLHQAISKKRPSNIVLIIQKIAAVLIVPLLIFSIWQSTKRNEQQLVQHEISTPPTLRSTFVLPDGTKVYLNGGSTITFPSQFSNTERLIEFTGEAYFEVVSNPKKPFLVKTGNHLVEAVGTQFNCMAYPSSPTIETVLIEGIVNILLETPQGRKKIAQLKPNQLATYNKTSRKTGIDNIEPNKYIAWKSGQLIFKEDLLENVLYRLENWYNVEFETNPSLLGTYAFTGSFKNQELSQILTYIELTTPIKFEIQTHENEQELDFPKKIIKIKSKK